jgi:hypothetical protein
MYTDALHLQELQYGSLIDDVGGWLGWVQAQLPTTK